MVFIPFVYRVESVCLVRLHASVSQKKHGNSLQKRIFFKIDEDGVNIQNDLYFYLFWKNFLEIYRDLNGFRGQVGVNRSDTLTRFSFDPHVMWN